MVVVVVVMAMVGARAVAVAGLHGQLSVQQAARGRGERRLVGTTRI